MRKNNQIIDNKAASVSDSKDDNQKCIITAKITIETAVMTSPLSMTNVVNSGVG